MNQYQNFLEQKHLLNELAKPKSRYRISILKKADPKLILAICEAIYNLLEGNIIVDSKTKELLKKDKKILRKLVEKNPFLYKKKILVQRGGFLPALLPVVLSTLATVVTALVENK
jgi:ABC-type glutathione transport system ATPase component